MAEPGASLAPAPTVWALTSRKLGDNAQLLTVAKALGWPTVAKRLEFADSERSQVRDPSLGHVDLGRSSALAPPWPDVVLTTGRQSIPVALWIRQQSGDRTKIVQFGQFYVSLDRFDLVVASSVFDFPAAPNVVRLSFPIVTIDAGAIAAAVAEWEPRLRQLPRPWTALLVGGRAAPYILDAKEAQRLMRAANEILDRDGGSLLVATSRRTAPEAGAAIEAAMPRQGFFHRWTPDERSNPYRALLGMADRFIVTGDSVTMLVEAAQQRKPIAVYRLPEGRRTLYQRCAGLLRSWFLPAGRAAGGDGGPRRRIGSLLVRLGLPEHRRDLSAFHRELVARGLAVWAGEPFPTVVGTVPDELPLLVRRIEALLAQTRARPCTT